MWWYLELQLQISLLLLLLLIIHYIKILKIQLCLIHWRATLLGTPVYYQMGPSVPRTTSVSKLISYVLGEACLHTAVVLSCYFCNYWPPCCFKRSDLWPLNNKVFSHQSSGDWMFFVHYIILRKSTTLSRMRIPGVWLFLRLGAAGSVINNHAVFKTT